MENSMKIMKNQWVPRSLPIDQGMVTNGPPRSTHRSLNIDHGFSMDLQMVPVRSKLLHLKVIPLHLGRRYPVGASQVP
jgi:hypothetical protein